MCGDKDWDEMSVEEQEQWALDNLEDEYYKTQNEMDSPTGEDD